MSTDVSSSERTSFLPAELFRPPLLGLMAFVTVYLWKPVAHSLSVLHGTYFPGTAELWSGAIIGLAGWTLVWRGFGKDDLTATMLGFFGGGLLWLGWFETGFDFFAHYQNVPPVGENGMTILTPNLLIMQATFVPLIAILIFLGANKDTRCRMFKWFHRNARLKPEAPTVGYRRQYSRITALEMVTVSWFFYVLNIMIYDPRFLGPMHPVTLSIYGIFIVWAIYLIYKLSKEREMAFSIRYAIPTVGVAWLPTEMSTHMGLYKEVWIYPTEYVVTNLMIAAALIAGVVAILNVPKRSGAAA